MAWLPKGFDFIRGLAGLIGGFVVMLIGLFLTAIYQVYTEAGGGGLWEILAYIGLAILVFAPLWYWLGRPLYIRFA